MEATDLLSSYGGKRAITYRYNEMRSIGSPYLFRTAFGPAEADTFQLSPAQLNYTSVRIATETQHIRNTMD